MGKAGEQMLGGELDTDTTRKKKVVWGVCTTIGLALIFGVLLHSGCGHDDSNALESKQLVPHNAIRLDGGADSESYLKISSKTEGESAVTVINGGHLTLHDATIWKIGDEASGSPTYAMGAGKGDSSPGAENAGGPPPVGPRSNEIPGSDLPGNGVTEGSKSNPDTVEDTNPGPGATHAGVFAGSGGIVSLSNVSIETGIGEGTGIYSSGEGSSVILENGTITTDGSTAHGVFASHEGRVVVRNVTIITKGEHSSALATYQNSGTVIATGGTYTAFGEYSAGIYSASDISVEDVICKSVSDNAAVVENGSRIILKDSALWSREKGAVMIYQTVTSKYSRGPSKFEMTGGSITAEEGPIFYVTNTTGIITLNHVELLGTSGILLKALKGDWGVDLAWAKPTQGGTVTIVADNQSLPGDIIVDEYSTVTATLKNGSTLEGSINTDNKGKGVNLTLDSSSSWHVTKDSYLTGLFFPDGISGAGMANIIGNGHSVYYDKAASPALGGKVYDLPKGGKLMPKS